MKKIGLIDYYLDQYHAHHYPQWIREQSGGEMEVAYAWAKTDKPDGMTNEAYCREQGIQLLGSMEEVIERSDCLVVMSPDNPEQHEELCRLPLSSGKPTYVDKTFAPDRETALRIAAVAQEHGTPFFSTSALRYAREYADIRREGIESIHSRGPGRFSNYAIHQMEPIVSLMGADDEKIQYTGTANTPAFLLRYADGRTASFVQLGWECDFSLAINYADWHAEVIQGANDFYLRFLKEMVGFFGDGVPRVPVEETIEVITLLEYGRKAMDQPDSWVTLPR